MKEAVPDIITRKDNPFLKEEEKEETEGEEGKVKAIPNKQRDDLARRRAQSKPLPHRDGPVKFVSSSMSQADMQKWERLKMTEPRCRNTHSHSEHTCSSMHFMLLYVSMWCVCKWVCGMCVRVFMCVML